MASQRLTIAKLGGEAGFSVISRFRGWAALRSADDPEEWTPEQWPIEARREMDRFASSLKTHGHELPVLFFNESVDHWLMGSDYDRWLLPRDGPRAIKLHGDRHELWCYPLPDDGILAESLQRASRSNRIRERTWQEERWFRLQLLEAVLAWEPLVEVGAIVVLREVLGGLVEDHEVEEAMKIVPGWVVE
jgi:hypothetical protein